MKEEGWERCMAEKECSEIKQVTREATGEPAQAIEDILLKAVGFSTPLGGSR